MQASAVSTPRPLSATQSSMCSPPGWLLLCADSPGGGVTVSDAVLRNQADGGRHVLLVGPIGRIGMVFGPLRALMAGLGYGRYAAHGGDCAPPSPPQIGRELGRPARNRASTLWPARRKHARPEIARLDRQGLIGWKADCRCLTNVMIPEGTAGSTPRRGRSDGQPTNIAGTGEATPQATGATAARHRRYRREGSRLAAPEGGRLRAEDWHRLGPATDRMTFIRT